MPKVTYAYFGLNKLTGKPLKSIRRKKIMEEERYLYAFVDEDLVPTRGRQRRMHIFKAKGYAIAEWHKKYNRDKLNGVDSSSQKVGIYKLVNVVDIEELERR